MTLFDQAEVFWLVSASLSPARYARMDLQKQAGRERLAWLQIWLFDEQLGLTHGLTNDAVIEFGLVEFKPFLTGAQGPLLPCSGKHQAVPCFADPGRFHWPARAGRL